MDGAESVTGMEGEVVVMGDLFVVDLEQRVIKPIYWKGEISARQQATLVFRIWGHIRVCLCLYVILLCFFVGIVVLTLINNVFFYLLHLGT